MAEGALQPSFQIADLSLRRRWLFLLPAVFITYSLAYLDRANFGFGAAAGLATTLHITSGQSSLLAGLFFAGYFAFQLPGAIIARKHSPVRLIFFALIPWGILSALTGVITTFWALAVIRFLLGVAESCIFPAMLLLLTQLVHPQGTFPGQYLSDPRQSRHGALDVRGHGLPDSGGRVAAYVYLRGDSIRPLGRSLDSLHTRQT